MKKLGKHGGRLIIRNLPFSITESFLRKILEKIGKLKELTIPIEKSKNRNKGFAFVEFLKKNISEKAIKTLNNTKIQNRQISIDYALSKDKYQASIKAEEMSKEFKPQPHENQPEIHSENPSPPVSPEPSSRPSQKSSKFEEGKVLFIMNLNYETEEDDLYEFFSGFGKLKYAKIVLNKDTGESKGLAFVCFKKTEDAEKVLKIAEDSIELHDRKLKIVKAVSKDAVGNLKAEKHKKDDKKNLGLAKMGIISPKSEEFKSLSKKEIEMRTDAARKMKEKLLNPNVFVSPTRLLFKNIPKTINSEDLKTLVKSLLIKNSPEFSDKKIFKQVKVLYEKEKLDKEGNPLSKGIAFVEFSKHEYALAALKNCNNSKAFGEKQKPIVEFALEDHRILRIRNLKLKRQQSLLQKIASDKEKSTEKISRGKKQRLKRKMMRELQET